jgi:hypothetical protein
MPIHAGVMHSVLRVRVAVYATLLGVALVAGISALARPTPAAKCMAARYRLVGKALRGELQCQAPVAAGKQADAAACSARVRATLQKGWQRSGSSACAAASLETVTSELDGAGRGVLDLLHPTTAPSRCAAAKIDRAARYAQARLTCAARASQAGVPPTHASVVRCVHRARARLAVGFQRLESRFDCQTSRDATTVDETLESFVGCVDATLAGGGACGTTTTTTTTPGTTTTTANGGGSTTTLPVTTTTSVTTSTTAAASTTTSTTSTTTTSSTSTTVTTTVTTSTSTSSTLLPCGGLYPVCLGSCPAGQECSGDSLLEVCACQPITTTTTTSASTTTSSTLLPCGGLYPICLGSCPEGQACTGDSLLEVCGCQPIATTTTTTPSTTTTTTAAPGSTTTTTSTSTTTTITLLPCGGLYPVCLGSCPEGQACTGDSLLEVCACQPIVSTTTTTLLPCGGLAPLCLGSCPPGLSCTGNLLGNCTCQ